MENVYQYRGYGSIILFGEYASNHLGYTIVAPIDQFITAHITLRNDSIITIKSDLGSIEASISSLPVFQEMQYVCGAIHSYMPLIKSGFDLVLHSTLDIAFGFGSSGASIVSTLGALDLAFNSGRNIPKIGEYSVQVSKNVSPYNSGADCMASALAKTIAYEPRTKDCRIYRGSFDLTAIYSGTHADRKKKIQEIEDERKSNPVKILTIFKEIAHITELAMRALENRDLHRVGELMSLHHECQVDLGTSTPVLDQFYTLLKNDHHILGAKITGEGGGDCVLGLGSAVIDLPIEISKARVFHLKTL